MGYAVWYEPGMSADHIIPAARLKSGFYLARSFYYGIGGSFDLIAQGNRPFGRASIRAILRTARNAALHARRARVFEACRELERIRGFVSHQLVCLRRKEVTEYCRRKEWLSFDFSAVRPVGRSPARSQW
jgi:hypothetical protein